MKAMLKESFQVKKRCYRTKSLTNLDVIAWQYHDWGNKTELPEQMEGEHRWGPINIVLDRYLLATEMSQENLNYCRLRYGVGLVMNEI